MRKSLLASVLAATMVAGVAPLPTPAAAQTIIINPFFYYGHRYCWYDDAWRGPGWYWCGYAWHRGWGWGGGYGWRGHGGRWRDGGGWHEGGGWHGGDHDGWRGERGEGWGGGWRGGWGGGWHGGWGYGIALGAAIGSAYAYAPYYDDPGYYAPAYYGAASYGPCVSRQWVWSPYAGRYILRFFRYAC